MFPRQTPFRPLILRCALRVVLGQSVKHRRHLVHLPAEGFAVGLPLRPGVGERFGLAPLTRHGTRGWGAGHVERDRKAETLLLIRSREWVVRPMQENLGETPAEAIRPGSKFLRVMANITPETAVTLWCYPDSFEAFRAVREELHRRGLPTAGRPLPEGAPIGGSADGSKSVVH